MSVTIGPRFLLHNDTLAGLPGSGIITSGHEALQSERESVLSFPLFFVTMVGAQVWYNNHLRSAVRRQPRRYSGSKESSEDEKNAARSGRAKFH